TGEGAQGGRGRAVFLEPSLYPIGYNQDEHDGADLVDRRHSDRVRNPRARGVSALRVAPGAAESRCLGAHRSLDWPRGDRSVRRVARGLDVAGRDPAVTVEPSGPRGPPEVTMADRPDEKLRIALE